MAQQQHEDGGEATRRSSWKPVTTNRMYEEYYKGLGIIPEGEWDSFLSCLRSPLPTTFRVTQGAYLSGAISAKLEAFSAKGPIQLSGDGPDEPPCTIDPPSPLSWYPNRAAWKVAASRRSLKRSPELAELYRFVVAQNEQGNVTRQEAVSMIPPLFLDVQPSHRVWDMCAAPGSKTTELLEILHGGCAPGEVPTGYVVANDVNIERCFMLVHQTKRMGSPCFVVTCHSAETYPRPAPLVVDGVEEPFAFDRILCDVCCSSDGTLRKNPDLWRKWHPRLGTEQHKKQVKIAARGVQLLKAGGRMVYSTCSLNPVEDEAVIATLLLASKGELELVDVSSQLPTLKRMPGVSSWRVYVGAGHGEGMWVDKHEDLVGPHAKRVAPTCFAPPAEVTSPLHLERCMRFLPHHQDTGGFFVAVLAKKCGLTILQLTDEPAATAAVAEGAPQDAEGEDAEECCDATEKKKRPPGKKMLEREQRRLHEVEEPYLIVKDTTDFPRIRDVCRDFYEIDDSFPMDHLVTRCQDFGKLMLVNSGILQLMKSTPSTQLRIVSVGLKLLHLQRQKHSPECPYRLSMESLAWILPHMGQRRVVHISHEELCVLLTIEDVPFDKVQTEASRSSLKEMAPGCFVVTDNEDRLSLCAWRGINTFHLLVPKEELASLRNLYAPHIAAPVGTQSNPLSHTTSRKRKHPQEDNN